MSYYTADKYVSGISDYDLFMNKNTDWTRGKFISISYFSSILLFWGLLNISGVFNVEDNWTVTNVVHSVITFVLFHWIKGNPDLTTQGEYNGLTLYEQIDAGIPWTTTKKILMLVPTLLTWVACHYADYKSMYIVVNCGLFLICIIAKIPEMHRVRIFGINSTLGFDDVKEN